MEPIRVASQTSDTPSVSTDSSAPQKVSSSADAKGGVQPGLYTYKDVKGIPFSAEYFKMSLYYDKERSPKETEDLDAVDEYIQSVAKKRGLSDTKESYEEVLNGVLKQIGKSKNEAPDHLFKRVSTAIQALSQLESAKLAPVLSADSFNAKELATVTNIEDKEI